MHIFIRILKHKTMYRIRYTVVEQGERKNQAKQHHSSTSSNNGERLDRALDAQDLYLHGFDIDRSRHTRYFFFTAECTPGRLPVFMYIRPYFGSSLGWSCSGLSAVLVGLRVVNPAACLTSSFARSLSAAETMQTSILTCLRVWLRRGSMQGSGSGKTKPRGGVRGACTQFTQFACCPTTRRRCGTFEKGQPGIAAGGGVANPRDLL